MKALAVLCFGLVLIVQQANAQVESSGDTVEIRGRTVIFFGPGRAEFDSLSRDQNSGIEDALDDFVTYNSLLKPYLDSLGINTIASSAPYLHFRFDDGSNLCFRRNEFKGILGMIVSDGVRQPEISYGALTDEDWKVVVNKYYRIH